ncbi:hypothetical protein TRFO_01525 [Tritrichomonas foetus]|uniref:F5/8 type C domain-containing protein n=1 Tax=Tritrichomonas foetus TaxID=1144522 RepID=A0A1J4JXV6_9EUKA|nr:hypothetical protein TRFO_01525 [Tritrichomonas foetus]|eukprot:OHT03827.1 hypothetical protein TRFO_01525 [Tritrichomonas foetus]
MKFLVFYLMYQLKPIIEHEKQLTLIHNGHKYSIDPFICATYSRKFRNNINERGNIFTINKDIPDNAVISFIHLIHGCAMKLSKDTMEHLFYLAADWGIPSLTNILVEYINDGNLLPSLKRANEYEKSKYFPFYSKTKQIFKEDIHGINRILTNPNFQISDIQNYLQFVLRAIDKYKMECSIILSKVDFQQLIDYEKNDLLKKIKENEVTLPNSSINETIFELLKDHVNKDELHREIHQKVYDHEEKKCYNVLTQTNDSKLGNESCDTIKMDPKPKRSEILIKYRKGKELFGIFSLLNYSCGGNSHSKGIINITSSSSAYSYPSVVINIGSSGCWGSTDTHLGAWIQFDFKEKRIKLCAYTLKTYHSGGYSASHMKSWAVMGSDDESNWSLLDEQRCNKELNGDDKFFTWKCKVERMYKIIRIIQTGKNHCGRASMWLNNVEFFGYLA